MISKGDNVTQLSIKNIRTKVAPGYYSWQETRFNNMFNLEKFVNNAIMVQCKDWLDLTRLDSTWLNSIWLDLTQLDSTWLDSSWLDSTSVDKFSCFTSKIYLLLFMQLEAVVTFVVTVSAVDIFAALLMIPFSSSLFVLSFAVVVVLPRCYPPPLLQVPFLFLHLLLLPVYVNTVTVLIVPIVTTVVIYSLHIVPTESRMW